MLGIMAVMDQEDFYMFVVGPGSGMCEVVGIGSCAILGWNIVTSLVTFARWLVLSMLRVSVCGLPCQWLVASLGEIMVAVGLRSRGVWRSLW